MSLRQVIFFSDFLTYEPNFPSYNVVSLFSITAKIELDIYRRKINANLIANSQNILSKVTKLNQKQNKTCLKLKISLRKICQVFFGSHKISYQSFLSFGNLALRLLIKMSMLETNAGNLQSSPKVLEHLQGFYSFLHFAPFPPPFTMLFLITKTGQITFSWCMVQSHKVHFVNILFRGGSRFSQKGNARESKKQLFVKRIRGIISFFLLDLLHKFLKRHHTTLHKSKSITKLIIKYYTQQ